MKKMLLLSALVIPGSVFASEVSDGSDISCYEEEYQVIQSYENVSAPAPAAKQVSKATAASFSSQRGKTTADPYFQPKNDKVSVAPQTSPRYNKVIASPYSSSKNGKVIVSPHSLPKQGKATATSYFPP